MPGTASCEPKTASFLQVIALSGFDESADWSTAISCRSFSLASFGSSAARAETVVATTTTAASAATQREISSHMHGVILVFVMYRLDSNIEDIRPCDATASFESSFNGNSNSPRRAERFASQAIGLRVVDVLVLLGIVFELASQEQRVVGPMTRDVCVAGRFGVGLRLVARLDAVQEVAHVERGRVAADLGHFSPGEQLRRTQHKLAAVARFDPTRFAFETHRAGTETDPAFFAEDQFDAVFVPADDLVRSPADCTRPGHRYRRRPIGKDRRSGSPTPTRRRRPVRRPSRSGSRSCLSCCTVARRPGPDTYPNRPLPWAVRVRACCQPLILAVMPGG